MKALASDVHVSLRRLERQEMIMHVVEEAHLGRKPLGVTPWQRRDRQAYALRTTLGPISGGPDWSETADRSTFDVTNERFVENMRTKEGYRGQPR